MPGYNADRERGPEEGDEGGYDVWDENYEDYRRAQVESGISDADEVWASIPILGDSWRGELARRRRELEEGRNRRAWERLGQVAPSAEDLTARYEDEVWADGGPSAWAVESEEGATGRRGMEDALGAMREWSRGGFTDTDRSMMDEAERREGMRARADREAAMSALEARGMGGSGATLASMMSADEAASARGAGMYSDMLSAAQARQIDATRAMADIGSRARGHDETRTAGMEGWLNREADYVRDLGERNTNRHNRERDNEVTGNQQEFENRTTVTAGATGNYNTNMSARERALDRAEENSDDAANFLGTLATSLAG